MSKVESLAVVSPSPQYLAWLARERRGHRFVRAAQLAILVVFLVLWEVLPKALMDPATRDKVWQEGLARGEQDPLAKHWITLTTVTVAPGQTTSVEVRLPASASY